MSSEDDWVIHWISACGGEFTGLLEGSESEAIVEACRLHREGAKVRRIDGPRGRMITYGEVVRFYETHRGIPAGAGATQGSHI
jgi:hypothetical protein